MASSFGGTIKLQGESEYRKALKDITSNLRLVSSELKLATTEFTNGDKSVKQTKTSYDNMNKSIQEQKTKISELREALSQAEKEYGSNNEKVKTFKTQLNNAENQLKQMESATDKSTKELKEMEQGFDDAGNGALKFGDILKANVMGDAIVGGIKAVGSAIKTLGSSLVGIGKQALDNYGNYEQLVGGVDTLFKDSSGKVQEYANNAYKTAGLSANQYMETVTSFSASLLQSLNGDTAKSAEVADMAITDMADNANKMGTSMEMIQNAYQGFAKQNYTMLDNLKLGYGGTKGEMERLLADASELSGKEYNISNLNDVYEAIHIIQQEIGITGTTAQEASGTMTGSVSAMKSAWQNLLTGVADDSADLGQLINNLIESIMGKDGEGGVFNNIMPRVEIIIGGIVDLVMSLATRLVEYMPTLLQTGMGLLQTILDGITSMLPQLLPVVIQIVNSLVAFLTENLPTILQAGITILVELVKGIAGSLPTLIPAMIDAVLLMVETLIDNIDMIIDAGIQLIIGLAEGLIEALPDLIDKIPVIIDKLITAITNNLPKLIEAGIKLTVQLAVGLIKAIPDLIKAIPQIISSLINGFADYYSKLGDVGKNLITGLWNGIKNAGAWLRDKISGFFGGVVDSIKDFFGIHSPSKLFEDEIGKNLALGVGEGFGDTMSNVSKDMANAIPTEFDTSVNMKSSSSSTGSSYDLMVSAFKQALTDVKVVMNDREMGTFVADTMERVVYS